MTTVKDTSIQRKYAIIKSLVNKFFIALFLRVPWLTVFYGLLAVELGTLNLNTLLLNLLRLSSSNHFSFTSAGIVEILTQVNMNTLNQVELAL